MLLPALPERAYVYPLIDAALADMYAALAMARRTRKRAMLNFGAGWCGDCRVLYIYFHPGPNLELLPAYTVRMVDAVSETGARR